jgi:hypothetical protein
MAHVFDRERQWTTWSLVLTLLMMAFVIYFFANLLGDVTAVEGWTGQ